MAIPGNLKELVESYAAEAHRIRTDHLEVLAHAFLKETGLYPSEACLCEEVGKDGVIRWWFERKG